MFNSWSGSYKAIAKVAWNKEIEISRYCFMFGNDALFRRVPVTPDILSIHNYGS